MNKNCLIHSDLEQGTREWLEVRAGKCTSSEADKLYAAKKGFETYLLQKESELYLEVFEPGYESEAMRRGTELEPMARDLFMRETLLDVREVGFVERPDLNAGWSPDGLIHINDNPWDCKHGIEIKCRNAVNHFRVIKNGIDEPTYRQMQFAMAISDLEMMYFIAYNPDFVDKYKLFVQEIPRSEELSINTVMLLKKVKSEIGL